MAILSPVVVRDEALRCDVVLVEAQMRGGHGERPDVLAGREPLERRNLYLDPEAPTGFQMRGDVAEALNLLVLRVQVLYRVAHEVGQLERPGHPGGREVADGHADAVGARFRPQLCDHGWRQIN